MKDKDSPPKQSMPDYLENLNESSEPDRLTQFHTRFRRTTFSKIQGIEEETGLAKAEITRRLVRKGLEQITDSDKMGVAGFEQGR